MAFLLVLYLAVAGQRAVLFMLSGEPVAVAIGVALAVLPILGFWLLGRELLFAATAQRLADRLAEEGALPKDDLPRLPSGRPQRSAADAAFPPYREAVERAPDDWRAWFRLGLAYDAAGDRKRGRDAVREAIRLERSQRA
ncbi:tetratricopeptide repeat protein [Naasia sp. SYSU D00057]|uniref:tetratricopeptide repeat protein n=1 Tax=Naasia sp. SYSU D00057 TaxID=2817380 RepID=UPI001B30571E|nr:tetratricopeptide repeat protein [Naasia sp. SYSU D00057]